MRGGHVAERLFDLRRDQAAVGVDAHDRSRGAGMPVDPSEIVAQQRIAAGEDEKHAAGIGELVEQTQGSRGGQPVACRAVALVPAIAVNAPQIAAGGQLDSPHQRNSLAPCSFEERLEELRALSQTVGLTFHTTRRSPPRVPASYVLRACSSTGRE